MADRKHPNQRHRHESKARGEYTELPRGADLTWPTAPQGWHDAARRWYESLQVSAQVRDYQASDVALAMILGEDLSRHLNFADQPIGGAALASFLSGCEQLLCSAGSRRRARMELAAPDAGAEHRLAAVQSLAERRPGDNGA